MLHLSALFTPRVVFRALAGFWLAAVPAPANAGDPPSTPTQLPAGGTVRVSTVVDGDTVALADGRQVRLVGLQAPKLPLGRKNFPTWPLAEASKLAMERLSLGRDFTLHYGGAQLDRHGRILAHMVRDDGLWLQAQMLKSGMARVYTFADNRALVAPMLAHERSARAADRGIWRLRYYQPLTPETATGRRNSFQLVQGRVVDVAQVRGVTYLNFGPDWRTDFTVRIGKKAAKLFARDGIDLMGLNGADIEVRGWLKFYNGPMIEINHPDPLQVLPPARE